jgi:hypothetical protein
MVLYATEMAVLTCRQYRSIKIKGKKGKVVPLRSIEAHLGDRRYRSHFLNLGTRRG